jgi:hypothetical protein
MAIQSQHKISKKGIKNNLLPAAGPPLFLFSPAGSLSDALHLFVSKAPGRRNAELPAFPVAVGFADDARVGVVTAPWSGVQDIGHSQFELKLFGE